MWFLKLILVVGVASVVIVVLAYAIQTRMVFPTWLSDRHEAHLPETATRLTVKTSNGIELHGVHVPAERQFARRRPLLLGFGGNAWNADGLAEYLHELMPDRDVVTFHYRGYKPSGGRPSAAGLLNDASVVYDYVVETLGNAEIIAVGASIGSGVAAYLASERPVAGLILITPFDSLSALAQEHYPLIGRLLYHRIDTVDYLRTVTAPTAVIAAAHDTIVPPQRTAPVRGAARNLVFDGTIANVDHNDIYKDPGFVTAMGEAIARIQAQPSMRRTTASVGTDAPARAGVRTGPDVAG